MGFILFIAALILTALISLVSFILTPIYYIISFKWRSGIKQLDKWFLTMAISIDQFGNVSCASALQLCLIKKGSPYIFGHEDDTVSYILAQNLEHYKLTKLGYLICLLINILENLSELFRWLFKGEKYFKKDHFEIAIDKKIIADREAAQRLKDDEYYNRCTK
jgi:hypothetical protein